MNRYIWTLLVFLCIYSYAFCLTCYDVDDDDPGVCGGNGRCANVDNCICRPSYIGNECKEFIGDVSTGFYFSVVLRPNHKVYAFGDNAAGRLGLGDELPRLVPAEIPFFADKDIVQISSGYIHSLALGSDGKVYSWGANAYGILGHEQEDLLEPTQVAGLENIVQVGCGTTSSLVLNSSGKVYTWGRKINGQIGDEHSTSTYRSTPEQVANLDDVVQMAVGVRHSFFLKSDGTVYGFGFGAHGQMGNDPPVSTNLLQQIAGLSDVVEISCGLQFNLVQTKDGKVYSFGRYVALGLGLEWEDQEEDMPNQLFPQEITKLENVTITHIFAKHYSSFVVTDELKFYAFGDNSDGQLGFGDDLNRPYPEELTFFQDKHVKKVAARSHTLVLTEDAAVYSFGLNEHGRTGLNIDDESKTLTPTVLFEAERFCYGKSSHDEDVCSGNGDCTNADHCHCPGYTGDECTAWTCFGADHDDPDACSGDRGECVGYNDCDCSGDFYGDECTQWKCFGIDKDDSNVCGGHGSCGIDGQCDCDANYSGDECNQWNCFDTAHDASGVCNGLGNCTAFDSCQCEDGYTGDECEGWSCFETDKDDSGVCNGFGNCVGPNECECVTGHSGDDCNEFSCYEAEGDDPVCSDHGDCVGFNDCECESGYSGDECNEWSCFGADKDASDACNGHGSCIGSDECECSSGYSGDQCNQLSCFDKNSDDSNVCNGHGNCVGKDTCQCSTGYSGAECDQWTCFDVSSSNPAACAGHGNCVGLNQCRCLTGYTGPMCNVVTCFGFPQTNQARVCHGHGACTAVDQCICRDSFHGMQCSKPPWLDKDFSAEMELFLTLESPSLIMVAIRFFIERNTGCGFCLQENLVLDGAFEILLNRITVGNADGLSFLALIEDYRELLIRPSRPFPFTRKTYLLMMEALKKKYCDSSVPAVSRIHEPLIFQIADILNQGGMDRRLTSEFLRCVALKLPARTTGPVDPYGNIVMRQVNGPTIVVTEQKQAVLDTFTIDATGYTGGKLLLIEMLSQVGDGRNMKRSKGPVKQKRESSTLEISGIKDNGDVDVVKDLKQPVAFKMEIKQPDPPSKGPVKGGPAKGSSWWGIFRQKPRAPKAPVLVKATCQYYDEEEEQWKTDGVESGPLVKGKDQPAKGKGKRKDSKAPSKGKDEPESDSITCYTTHFTLFRVELEYEEPIDDVFQFQWWMGILIAVGGALWITVMGVIVFVFIRSLIVHCSSKKTGSKQGVSLS